MISRVPGKTTEHFLEKVTFPKPLFPHIRKMFKNSKYTQNVSTNVRQTDYPRWPFLLIPVEGNVLFEDINAFDGCLTKKKTILFRSNTGVSRTKVDSFPAVHA